MADNTTTNTAPPQEDWKDKAEDMLENAKDKAEDILEAAKEKAGKVWEEVKDKRDQLKLSWDNR